MTETSTITVRLDEALLASLDQLVEYMRKSTEMVGMKPTRSDAVRLCITGYLFDHGDAMRRMYEEQAKQP